jgi:AraC-like DNA-binding protein
MAGEMPPATPPFSFRQVPAPPGLADVVETLWVARGTIAYGRERILPSVRPVLIVNLGSPFRVQASRRREGDGVRVGGWLVGPQSGYVENEPMAETNVVGATLQPWGPAALFGISANELRDRVVDLDLLWGPGLQRLRCGLDECVDASDRIRLLARSLAPRRRSRPPGLVGQAMVRLAQRGAPRVADVSAELEISRKHLSALFGRYVGLSPGTFARVQRFDRTLQSLVGPLAPPLAQLAHDHGYYDQAHMNRDFTAFGGVTPTEYLRQRGQHMTSDGDDESGLFVPGL